MVCTAVEALSAAHLANLGALPTKCAQVLHIRTLVLLAGNVCRKGLMELDTEAHVATSVLLIYYEVKLLLSHAWQIVFKISTQRTGCANTMQIVLGNSLWTTYSHLRGAKAIFDTQIKAARRPPGPRMLFLIKVLRYFDVILALSTKQPLLNFELENTRLLAPTVSQNLEIDDVLGFTKPLWPMLESVANLQARLFQDGEVRMDQVERLEEQISSWDVERTVSHCTGMDNIYGEAMLQIALSHKYSALLSLYSTFPGAAGHGCNRIIQSDLTQVAYRHALDSLMRVSVLSRTMSTILWPLYTVSMVADSTSDQLILQTIFDRFFQQHHMNVVRGAGDIVLKWWHKEFMEQKNILVLLG